MKRIAIFCASGKGKQPVFLAEAAKVGRFLAKKGVGIVYGGTHTGLMGALANAALAEGGEVTGVFPGFMKKKRMVHTGLTEQIWVETLAARKQKMAGLADGFIAMPGGIGTLDELFEMLAAAQLGLHQKPVGILNLHGYFDKLAEFAQTMHENAFLRAKHYNLMNFAPEIEQLLEKMGLKY